SQSCQTSSSRLLATLFSCCRDFGSPKDRWGERCGREDSTLQRCRQAIQGNVRLSKLERCNALAKGDRLDAVRRQGRGGAQVNTEEKLHRLARVLQRHSEMPDLERLERDLARDATDWHQVHPNNHRPAVPGIRDLTV